MGLSLRFPVLTDCFDACALRRFTTSELNSHINSLGRMKNKPGGLRALLIAEPAAMHDVRHAHTCVGVI